ncbi:MAG: hypothetical protein ACPGVO_24260, partial [Spirulinaceae cyanobacterium]
VLLIRDLDGREQGRKRLASLHSARQNHQEIDPNSTIVIGTAVPEREAWVLNGFVSQTPEEEQRLAECQQQLNFDPCREAHRLRGDKKNPEQRDRAAKFVLETLTDGSTERQEQCWTETDLELLRNRGKDTGLADYLNEIKRYLRPIVIPEEQ